MKLFARPFCHALPFMGCSFLAVLLSACQPADKPSSSGTPASQNPSSQDNVTPSSPDAALNDNAPLEMPETSKPKPILSADSTEGLNEMQANYDKAISKLTAEMQLMLSMNSVDVAFARGMLGHHRGAMDLTKLATRYGNNTQLQQLSEQITATEQAEIDALKKWLASHPDTREIDPMIEQARPAYHYAIDAMDAKMREARKSQQAEVSFAKIMLAYHRGAEAIAQTQLKYGQDEEMRALAQQIIDEQLTEIIALQSWLESQGIETYPRVLPLADSNAPLAETDALGVEGEKVKEAEPKSANIKETKAQIPEVRATEVKAAK